MSNYFYKNVPLNNIYASNGNSNTNNPFYGYVGIPIGTSTNYTGIRPVSFGYKSSGLDLSEYVTAGYTTYSVTPNEPVAVPQGCKSIRVISIGGGGGGGGQGGNATCEQKNTFSNNSATGNGGGGMIGGYGSLVYSNNDPNSNIPINVSSFTLEVGNGGAAGAVGNDVKNSVSGNGTTNASGGKGGTGGAGGSSYLTLGSSVICLANGGEGGDGGNGANATADATNGNSSSNKGNSNGNIANLQNNPYISNNVYPYIGYGGPGNADSPGYSGAVVIIYLYD